MDIKLTKEIKYRFSMIGKLPICNQKRERAPVVNKFVFLFCYRCTGIILGGIAASLMNYLNVSKQSYILLFVFITPCAIDGLIQELNILESNNIRRLITGFLLGIGLAFL